MNTFIKTSDAQTAEQLEKQGFTLLSKSGQIYTFANDGHKQTLAKELQHVSYSNRLEI